MIALPPYVDPDAWQGFEDMRRLIKKPMTDRARKLVLYELQRLKDAGHCPNAALDQSTNHCWADVYQPQDKPIQPTASAEHERTQQLLKAQAGHGNPPPQGWAATVKAKLRSVS